MFPLSPRYIQTDNQYCRERASCLGPNGEWPMEQTHYTVSDFELPGSPLLLIDDNAENLTLLRKTLEWSGYSNIHCCQSGATGLKLLSEQDPHLVILDLRMPGMDGFEFLETVRSRAADWNLPILVFTADLSSNARNKALTAGASDFLTKPGDPVEIKLKVRNFLRTRHLHNSLERNNFELESVVRDRTRHLEIARMEAIGLLAKAGEYRDDETGQHSHRVGEMSAGLAIELGLDRPTIDAIRMVAPLHDIGKIAIADSILRKEGALTEDEYETMKRHVTIGAELLEKKQSPLLRLAREVVLYHHERWDGKGYVAGLCGEDIPISARIVSVADTFDAITHDRPYRRARSEQEALAEIDAMAGSQFDPAVVDALKRLMDAPTVRYARAS